MRTYLNSILLFSALLLAPLAMHAAEGAAPAAAASDDHFYNLNIPLIGLVTLIVVLLFIIAVIGNVLRQLTFVYRDKMRAEQSSKASQTVKTILLLLALGLPAIHTFAADAAKTEVAAPAPAPDIIKGIANDDFYAITAIITLELIVIFTLMICIRVMLRYLSNKPELAPAAKKIMRRHLWDRMNNAVAIEKEKDILLDHDYDGIQELDNALPPWWKYGFYLTIIVAIIYLYRYQVAGTGPNPEQEYAAEMQQAAEDKAAYLAKSANNVDENNVTLLTDPSDLAAGQQVFQGTCFACHAKDGGGGVGPNLTDDYWLHGGGIKDIFKSIKYGWQDKGMKSWKDDFSPKQIAQIASYVKSLHGTHPAVPKDKQGDLYIEGSSAPKGADSTAGAGAKVASN